MLLLDFCLWSSLGASFSLHHLPWGALSRVKFVLNPILWQGFDCCGRSSHEFCSSSLSKKERWGWQVIKTEKPQTENTWICLTPPFRECSIISWMETMNGVGATFGPFIGNQFLSWANDMLLAQEEFCLTVEGSPCLSSYLEACSSSVLSLLQLSSTHLRSWGSQERMRGRRRENWKEIFEGVERRGKEVCFALCLSYWDSSAPYSQGLQINGA